jgi:hypothetical protein
MSLEKVFNTEFSSGKMWQKNSRDLAKMDEFGWESRGQEQR